MAVDAKRPTLRYIIIKMLKVKDKERTLKAKRQKQLVTYRTVPITLLKLISENKLYRIEGIARNIQSH